MVLGANTQNLTYNLRRKIGEYENARLDIWKAAFMDTYDRNLAEATNILTREATTAAATTKEYKYPIFLAALERATRNPEAIDFYPSSDFSRIIADIRLDRTGGTIEEYETAVLAVRAEVGSDAVADEASLAYWTAIYNAARTGTGRTREDATQSGGARQARLIDAYTTTITARLAELAADSPAPFWPLIDQGNMGTMKGNVSPHPVVGATRFVDNAKQQIENKFNNYYSGKLRQVIDRFVNDAEDINNIIEAVDDVLSGVPTDKRSLPPGRVFGEIEEANKRYFIYATGTRRVGITQRVRIY